MKWKEESLKMDWKSKDALYNIDTLYKARNNVIKFFDDYFSMASTIKYISIQGKGLKILAPKEMLQKLSIALARTKAGNNLESWLNVTGQIVYSLYQSKEIIKKVYNNVIKMV